MYDHIDELGGRIDLAAAGVPTVLRKYPDLIHGFFGMGGVAASAERAADQLCRNLRTMLAGTPAHH